jgi:hypothetical protein
LQILAPALAKGFGSLRLQLRLRNTAQVYVLEIIMKLLNRLTNKCCGLLTGTFFRVESDFWARLARKTNLKVESS